MKINKKSETSTLWLLWTIDTGKKYAKYISVYIKVKIVETWNYVLSCMRQYIVRAICRAQLVNDLVILNVVLNQ